MRIKERLIIALEDCGFNHEEAELIAEITQKHVIAEIVAKKMTEKVRKAK